MCSAYQDKIGILAGRTLKNLNCNSIQVVVQNDHHVSCVALC